MSPNFLSALPGLQVSEERKIDLLDIRFKTFMESAGILCLAADRDCITIR